MRAYFTNGSIEDVQSHLNAATEEIRELLVQKQEALLALEEAAIELDKRKLIYDDLSGKVNGLSISITIDIDTNSLSIDFVSNDKSVECREYTYDEVETIRFYNMYESYGVKVPVYGPSFVHETIGELSDWLETIDCTEGMKQEIINRTRG